MQKVKIEEKYKSLSDVAHILLRPGTYVGSTVLSEPVEEYVYDAEGGRFVARQVRYVPAFLKLFDEIFSNSIDESRRNRSLDMIKVTVDRKTGTISVYDNGGIPVEMHKGVGMYVPTMLFSKLRTGSNFDDAEKREGVGTNGFGATLTNIFSKRFTVKTCDKKRSFEQTFEDNMSRSGEPSVKINVRKSGYTEITYDTDFARFGMEGIDDDHYLMMEKRVMDAAAANPSVKFHLNGREIHFDSFADYCSLYTEGVIYEKGEQWEVAFAHSDTFRHVSIVNSAVTRDGGTHVNYIASQVTAYLQERIKKKYKVDVRPTDIRSHLFVFINCTVYNPAYSSQTKEKLITDVRKYGTSHTVGEKTLKAVFDSEITQCVLDWASRKSEADEKAAVRSAARKMKDVKIDKLVDAKGRDRKRCTLMLCEGDSPMAGFRRFRNPETQGAFPLRGKSLNVRNLTQKKTMDNQELCSIMSILGLSFDRPPFVYDASGRVIKENLRYGEIHIYSDADVDGISCAALLVNFFEKWFPELIKEHRVARCETPMIVATNKKTRKAENIYYESEWREWRKKHTVGDWEIDYKKGLAALTMEQYEEIIRNPRLYYYDLTDKSREKLEIWFGDDTESRKALLG